MNDPDPGKENAMRKILSCFLFLAVLSAGSAVLAEDNPFDREHSLWKKSAAGQISADRECKAAGESSIRLEKGATFSRRQLARAVRLAPELIEAVFP